MQSEIAQSRLLVHVRELNGETIDGLALVTVVLTIVKLVYGMGSELGVRNDSLGSTNSAEFRNSEARKLQVNRYAKTSCLLVERCLRKSNFLYGRIPSKPRR